MECMSTFVICQTKVKLSRFELMLTPIFPLIDLASQCPELTHSKLILSVSEKRSIDEVIPSYLSYS